jgi:hypothetical protein
LVGVFAILQSSASGHVAATGRLSVDGGELAPVVIFNGSEIWIAGGSPAGYCLALLGWRRARSRKA